ncbi:hypothetical protein TeGR_g6834, partial [Tetraparma gracilis]
PSRPPLGTPASLGPRTDVLLSLSGKDSPTAPLPTGEKEPEKQPRPPPAVGSEREANENSLLRAPTPVQEPLRPKKDLIAGLGALATFRPKLVDPCGRHNRQSDPYSISRIQFTAPAGKERACCVADRTVVVHLPAAGARDLLLKHLPLLLLNRLPPPGEPVPAAPEQLDERLPPAYQNLGDGVSLHCFVAAVQPSNRYTIAPARQSLRTSLRNSSFKESARSGSSRSIHKSNSSRRLPSLRRANSLPLYSFHLLVCSPDPETVTFRTISETMHGMLDPLGQTKLHRARFESDAPLPRAGQIEGSISFQSRGENQTELRMTVNTNVTDLAVDSGSPQVKPEVDGESHPSIFKMRTSAKLGVEDLVEAKKNPLAWLEDDPDAKPVERGERQARNSAGEVRMKRGSASDVGTTESLSLKGGRKKRGSASDLAAAAALGASIALNSVRGKIENIRSTFDGADPTWRPVFTSKGGESEWKDKHGILTLFLDGATQLMEVCRRDKEADEERWAHSRELVESGGLPRNGWEVEMLDGIVKWEAGVQGWQRVPNSLT